MGSYMVGQAPLPGLRRDCCIRSVNWTFRKRLCWHSRTTTGTGEMMAVSETNNESERTFRPPAQARDIGRTNKTPAGARHQTVIVSVLESLRHYLPAFTLSSVIGETRHWLEAGRSCFARLAEKLGLTDGQPHTDRPSSLDGLLPVPDG
jgi:hypothetical protein